MNVLTRRREIDRLFTEGARAAGPALLVIAAPTTDARDQSGRVLFVAGKRIGPAVVRNRAKRVMREAARRAGAPWAGWDVALVARSDTGTVGAGRLDAALKTGLARLGVTRA